MTGNVLVVEDNAELTEMIRLCLERRGHEVFAAYDGEQALKILHKNQIDLMILDLGLPKKSGLDVFHEITTRFGHSRIPVLVATGHDEMKDLFEDIEVDGFVSKPYELAELVRQVEQILDKKTEPSVFVVDLKGSAHSERIAEVLENERYIAAVAEDLSDFERLAARYTPRLVLLEYARTEMSGADFIQAVVGIMHQNWGCKVPVLAYSYSGIDYGLKSLSAGASGYLGCPSDDYRFFIHAIREFEIRVKNKNGKAAA